MEIRKGPYGHFAINKIEDIDSVHSYTREIVEENIPVKDFTIEGNSVVSVEEILATLNDMKGKPQNIARLNEAITKIQDLYMQKGYILLNGWIPLSIIL